MKSHCGSTLGRATRATALLAAVVWVATGPLAGQNVCVKTIGSASPTLDGVVAAGAATPGCMVDAVWNGVSAVEFWSGMNPSGGSAPGGYMYFAFRNPAGPANDRLWVGIDVAGDDNLTDWDLIFLLFDADNSNSWTAGDFYVRLPASNSAALINSGAQCNQSCGAAEYWEYDGAVWQQIGAASGAINSRVAYDYETAADPEQKIWNAEIDMPVSVSLAGGTRFDLQTAAPYFGVGAYVFVDRNHNESPNPQEGSVLRWPETMVDRTITDVNLFGIPSSEATELANASLTNTCFDVNFAVSDPWRINGFVANTYDNRIIRNAVNNFRVRYRYQGPDGANGTLANPGTVRLSLTPFNASFWHPLNEYTKTKELAVNPQTYDAEHIADFSWNFGTPAESWSAFESAHGTVDFLCARLQLVDFERDDAGGNTHWVNHNEFTTSDYTHELMFTANGIPDLKAGQSTTLRILMESRNDPSSRPAGSGGMAWWRRPSSETVAALWLAAAVVGLVVMGLGWRRSIRIPRWGYALLAAGVILAACEGTGRGEPKPGPIGTERWEATNAAELGLRPVKGDPGWYEMPIAHGEVKRLSLKFTGRPLPYKTDQRKLAAADSGRLGTTRVAVKPGQVVTVVAFGEVDLDGPDGPLAATTPTGFSLRQRVGVANRATAVRFPLQGGYYTPSDYAGALIGSFDNWKHSFVVGRAASVVVPPEASALVLAANVPSSVVNLVTGAFDLSIIVQPAPGVPTHTRTPGDATYHIPPTFDPWLVLTSLNVYSYHQVLSRDDGGRVLGATVRPLGAAHYSVYAVHADAPR